MLVDALDEYSNIDRSRDLLLEVVKCIEWTIQHSGKRKRVGDGQVRAEKAT